MRVFLCVALSACALLVSSSAQAHVSRYDYPTMLPPVHIEREVKPVFTYRDVASIWSERTAVVLASSLTGPMPRASFSVPRVSTSFRSTPAYRLFSPTPSCSFTFRASSPSTSSRPATTSAPRTYIYPLTRSARSSAPVSSPAEVHRYYNSGGGGGGLSATDIILLNQALNNSHQSQEYSNAGSIGRYVSSDRETVQSADSSDDGISGWGIFGIVILCLGIAAAF